MNQPTLAQPTRKNSNLEFFQVFKNCVDSDNIFPCHTPCLRVVGGGWKQYRHYTFAGNLQTYETTPNIIQLSKRADSVSLSVFHLSGHIATTLWGCRGKWRQVNGLNVAMNTYQHVWVSLTEFINRLYLLYMLFYLPAFLSSPMCLFFYFSAFLVSARIVCFPICLLFRCLVFYLSDLQFLLSALPSMLFCFSLLLFCSSICLSFYLSACPSICLPVLLFVCLSFYLSAVPLVPLSCLFLQVLDEEAEVFVVKMWRLLIYETEAKKLGLVKWSHDRTDLNLPIVQIK